MIAVRTVVGHLRPKCQVQDGPTFMLNIVSHGMACDASTSRQRFYRDPGPGQTFQPLRFGHGQFCCRLRGIRVECSANVGVWVSRARLGHRMPGNFGF